MNKTKLALEVIALLAIVGWSIYLGTLIKENKIEECSPKNNWCTCTEVE